MKRVYLFNNLSFLDLCIRLVDGTLITCMELFGKIIRMYSIRNGNYFVMYSQEIPEGFPEDWEWIWVKPPEGTFDRIVLNPEEGPPPLVPFEEPVVMESAWNPRPTLRYTNTPRYNILYNFRRYVVNNVNNNVNNNINNNANNNGLQLVFADDDDDDDDSFPPLVLADDDDDDDFDYLPTQDSPQILPMKLSDDWEKLLLPDSELRSTEDPSMLCLICCENLKTIVFWPCQHVLYCDSCFRRMMTTRQLLKTCGVCKEEFTNIIRPRF